MVRREYQGNLKHKFQNKITTFQDQNTIIKYYTTIEYLPSSAAGKVIVTKVLRKILDEIYTIFPPYLIIILHITNKMVVMPTQHSHTLNLYLVGLQGRLINNRVPTANCFKSASDYFFFKIKEGYSIVGFRSEEQQQQQRLG